ncbi:MAG: hypothetical protein M1840_007427 [Geoglossum simile]|nr:MAG: hypothetical protein M1840_007427 [Geoglossum simile]
MSSTSAMAQTAIVARAAPGESPYQLSKEQTLKASRALLAHIEYGKRSKDSKKEKRNLLADADEGSGVGETELDDVAIWLILTTKRHIIDKIRLKPGKISIPHSLNTSPTSTICLITADPQAHFKAAVADPSFPSELRARITRVIAISKLRAKYKPYESKRQLFSEHDIFIADDRVVTMLPPILGKAFYERGIKRPIAVSIGDGNERKSKGKVEKRMKMKKNLTSTDHSVASPQRLADEITKALSVALVHLSPSTCTAVRVGKASWDATKVAENIDTVVAGLVTKFVPKGWKNVRALHVKGAETAALPIWLADELWLDEGDITEDVPAGNGVSKVEGSKETKGASKKRRAPETGEDAKSPKKLKKAREGEGRVSPKNLAGEVILRKERLEKQKAEAKEEVETPTAVKKALKAGVAGDSVVRVKTKKSKS